MRVMSYNVEGLRRQLPIFKKLEKKFKCDFSLLQETQTSSIEENEFLNKFTKRGLSLRLHRINMRPASRLEWTTLGKRTNGARG